MSYFRKLAQQIVIDDEVKRYNWLKNVHPYGNKKQKFRAWLTRVHIQLWQILVVGLGQIINLSKFPQL